MTFLRILDLEAPGYNRKNKLLWCAICYCHLTNSMLSSICNIFRNILELIDIKTRKHSSRMRTALSSLYGGFSVWGGLPDRDLHWTETPLDRDPPRTGIPPDRDPPGQRPPSQRPPLDSDDDLFLSQIWNSELSSS